MSISSQMFELVIMFYFTLLSTYKSPMFDLQHPYKQHTKKYIHYNQPLGLVTLYSRLPVRILFYCPRIF